MILSIKRFVGRGINLVRKDERITEILENCLNSKLLESILTSLEVWLQERNLNPESYRWQSLANHLSIMIERKQSGEELNKLDLSIFSSIGEESVELSKRITHQIGLTQDEEVYLLASHFEAIIAEETEEVVK